MKNILSFIALAVILAAGIHAAPPPLSLSAGGGGLLGYTFTRYTLEADTLSGSHIKSIQNMDRFNYGGFLFFDAAYGEFALLIRGGQNTYEETLNGIDDQGTGTEVILGFSLLLRPQTVFQLIKPLSHLGKPAFRLNDKISWSPLAGVEYQIALLEKRKPKEGGGKVYDRTGGQLAADKDKNDNPYPLSAWNSWTIDIGAGFDYQLKDRLFLRNELLFSFRLQTDYETGALEMTKKQFNTGTPTLMGLTGGPTLRTSIGYRFK
ncbi:hypothetical protein AGMMS50268_05300 [Spirochaetia bacterium]|nr:hypothetical protein AGMMS50268_05300 [Spirochaetia bacterium]